MLFSSKLPLSFRTSNQQRKRISLLSHACHMPHPLHPPSLNHSNIQREVGDKTIKHLIMQFCPASSYFLHFESGTSLSISYLLTETLKKNITISGNAEVLPFIYQRLNHYISRFFFTCSYKCTRTWLFRLSAYNRNGPGVGWSEIHPTQNQAV
jgi:hypothetical protein